MSLARRGRAPSGHAHYSTGARACQVMLGHFRRKSTGARRAHFVIAQLGRRASGDPATQTPPGGSFRFSPLNRRYLGLFWFNRLNQGPGGPPGRDSHIVVCRLKPEWPRGPGGPGGLGSLDFWCRTRIGTPVTVRFFRECGSGRGRPGPTRTRTPVALLFGRILRPSPSWIWLLSQSPGNVGQFRGPILLQTSCAVDGQWVVGC